MSKEKAIEDAINSEFGNGILTSGQSIIDSVNTVIPVSPGLDMILGGGIPEGSFVIFTGPPKVGKTATALDFSATAQALKYACDIGRKEGRHIYYFDIEGRLKERDIKGIHHLDYDESRMSVIKSKPGNILYAENFIDISERLINERPGDIFILDSLSALCTEGEKKADIGDRYRADAPLLLARYCRRISNVVPINKSVVIGITHMIANQGQGMATWVEASGRKVQYQCDVKLRATHCGGWVVGDSQIGQDIHWIAEWNALNAPRNGKFISKFRYGYGLDKASEILNLCVDLGLIKKGGSWYTFPDGTKFQGLDKASDSLKQDEKLYEGLHQQIRDMMGL